jgi:hypothetical protein
MRRRAAAVVVLVLGALALLLLPAGRASATAEDDLLKLDLSAKSAHLAADDPIDLVTTVTNRGPASRLEVSSDTQIVTYDIEQVDGDQRLDGGASKLVCTTHDVLVDQTPHHVLFALAGGVDRQSAAIWDRYRANPSALSLPAGRWRLTAHMHLFLSNDCSGPPRTLSAAIEFDVR